MNVKAFLIMLVLGLFYSAIQNCAKESKLINLTLKRSYPTTLVYGNKKEKYPVIFEFIMKHTQEMKYLETTVQFEKRAEDYFQEHENSCLDSRSSIEKVLYKKNKISLTPESNTTVDLKKVFLMKFLYNTKTKKHTLKYYELFDSGLNRVSKFKAEDLKDNNISVSLEPQVCHNEEKLNKEQEKLLGTMIKMVNARAIEMQEF